MLEKSTYYVLDAQGNQLSMYEHEVDQQAVNYTLAERNIYGSARLGRNSHNIDLYTADLENPVNSVLGEKYYELSNHLGNVLAVINDVKYPVASGTTVDYFEVALVSVCDYSPFGMLMPGRSHQSGDYMYKFNGAESDDELKGVGNHYDLGLRNYDPRTGRMFSMDPRANEYPWQTTYAYHRNSPIMTIDYLGGGDGIYVDEETGEVLGQDEHGADDGLIHYTSKANWDDYGSSPYSNRSELLKEGGISQTINLFDEISRQAESSDNEEVGDVPITEFTQDVRDGVTLVTSILTASAEGAKNTEFKYPEPKATTAASKQTLRNLSKAAQKFALAFTVADKSVIMYTSALDGNYTKVTQEAVILTGYVVAATMMSTPTGVSQFAGALVFIGTGIYDIVTD